jgi:hypothetical protein
MALLVCAAYNSDAIVWVPFTMTSPFYKAEPGDVFANARNHGVNAMDLFAGLLASKGWYLDAQPILPAGAVGGAEIGECVRYEQVVSETAPAEIRSQRGFGCVVEHGPRFRFGLPGGQCAACPGDLLFNDGLCKKYERRCVEVRTRRTGQ